MKKTKFNIHTGSLLSNHLTRKFINKTELATTINRNPQSVTNYCQNASKQTKILMEICHALEHNFFQDIASQLPDIYTFNPELTSTYLQRLKDLEKENEVLKIQNELLMKIRG